MPLQMRLPKRGFKNVNRVEYTPLNLSRLQAMAEKFGVKTIDLDWLISNGVVGKGDKVKILAHGELKTPLTVSAHACSEAAKQAIEEKGGSINLV